MKNERNIICFGNLTWEGDYVKSTVKILTHLASNNRILFVDYSFTYKDLFLAILGKHPLASAKRMLGIAPRIRELTTETGTKVLILTLPPVFPITWIKKDKLFKWLLKTNSIIIRKAIQKAAKKYSFSKPVFINAFNQFYGENLIGKFNESLHLYYCFDHINVKRDGLRGINFEESFMPKVDGIIVTSDNLQKEKSKFNSRTYLVKNGVDFETFYSFSKKDRKTNGKKIVGYIGSIDFRFSTDLVLSAAEQFPDYEFHIVGRNDNAEAVKKLSGHKNIKILGAVPHNQIPGIMRNCHVGLIPYIPSEFTQSVYPLKINEYLAVGTPVVMTNFADLPEFNGIVYKADSKIEFCNAIKQAVEHPDPDRLIKGIELAKQNSWEKRTETFSLIIDNCLKK